MATWGYGLLGPVEVRVDGRPVPLPGVRQRLLLAMLLVNANRTVPAVRVIDELWGADLPADPRAALRTQVSRLRRALGPAGRDLATLEGGYRLAVPRGQLDFCRFEDALAEAAKAGGEPALRLLDEALALYRGPALGEFADRPFALATAARLEELHLAAAEHKAGLLLSLSLIEEAVAGLRAILAGHAEREQTRGLLMQALYRAAAIPRPWPASGRGASTWPPNSDWIPPPPCWPSSRTSCATRPRHRIPPAVPPPGRARCRCR